MNLISPDMRLTRDFLKKIYAAGVTRPDFPDEAIAKLEEAGCSRARMYFETWVTQFEAEQEAMLKEVAHLLAGEFRREAEERKRKERSAIERNRGTKHKFAGFPEDW